MRMPVSYPTEEAAPEPGTSWIVAPIAFLYQLPLNLWAMAFVGLMAVLGLLGWELSRSNSDLGGIARRRCRSVRSRMPNRCHGALPLPFASVLKALLT